MAQRLQAYLHKTRLGTFYFRWRPPKAERDRFDRDAYEISLGTKDRATAWHVAARAAGLAQCLLAAIRTMPKPKKTIELFSIELIRSFTLPDGTQEAVDYDASNPAEVNEAERIVAEIRARQRAAGPNIVLAPAVSAPASPAKISEAFQTYCDEKRQTGAWKDAEAAAKYDYGHVIREFTDSVTDKAIGSVTLEDLRRFRKRVLDGPGALATKKQKIQRLRQFLNWARDEGSLVTISTAVLKPPSAKGREKHYEPFTTEDLQLLFHSEAYLKQSFEKSHEFWIPLLGLYTGARINELAQLHLDDITVLDGIAVMKINDEGDKLTCPL